MVAGNAHPPSWLAPCIAFSSLPLTAVALLTALPFSCTEVICAHPQAVARAARDWVKGYQEEEGGKTQAVAKIMSLVVQVRPSYRGLRGLAERAGRVLSQREAAEGWPPSSQCLCIPGEGVGEVRLRAFCVWALNPRVVGLEVPPR